MTFPKVPLAAGAEVTLGKMLQPAQRMESDVLRPYLRAAHLQPLGRLDLDIEVKEMWFSNAEWPAYELRPGDVLVVEGGSVGRSVYLHEALPGFGFQNALIRLRPYENSDGRFINYSLQSAVSRGEVDLECSTVSIAQFTAEKVSRFRIPFPPLSVQRSIADYLDWETAEIDAMDADLD